MSLPASPAAPGAPAAGPTPGGGPGRAPAAGASASVGPAASLRLFRGYVALTFAFAWVPVMYTAFTVDKGFTPEQYLQLWSLYYATMVVAEVPFGWAADRWGCRRLLFAGPCVLAGSFALLDAATTFAAAATAMVVIGAGHAMISGADSAWLYDHLAATGRRETALHEESVAHRWRLLGVCVLDVAGGAVAFASGTSAAFRLSVAVMLAAALLAWRLPAPDPRGSGAVASPDGGPGSVRRITPSPPSWSGVRQAMAQPGVGWILGWYVAVFVLLRLGFQLYQPTLLALGARDLRLHGALLGGLNLVSGLAALWVVRVHVRLGERATASLVLLLIAASFAGLSLPVPAAMPLLCCLQQVAFAFLQPVGRTALNRRIAGGDRATLLSVQSMLARLACAAALALGPWNAALAGRLPSTYRALALLALLGALVVHATHRRAAPPLETTPRG
jgi:predicted MFS family arabinose efflux permease